MDGAGVLGEIAAADVVAGEAGVGLEGEERGVGAAHEDLAFEGDRLDAGGLGRVAADVVEVAEDRVGDFRDDAGVEADADLRRGGQAV